MLYTTMCRLLSAVIACSWLSAQVVVSQLEEGDVGGGMDAEQCQRVVRGNWTLADDGLLQSSRILRNDYPIASADQCFERCCMYSAADGTECNAAVFQIVEDDPFAFLEGGSGGTCKLLDCSPTFSNCRWQRASQASVAHVIRKRQADSSNAVLDAFTTSTASPDVPLSVPTSSTTAAPSSSSTSGDVTIASASIDAQFSTPTLPTLPVSDLTTPTTTNAPSTTANATDYDNYDYLFDDGFDPLKRNDSISTAAIPTDTPTTTPTDGSELTPENGLVRELNNGLQQSTNLAEMLAISSPDQPIGRQTLFPEQQQMNTFTDIPAESVQSSSTLDSPLTRHDDFDIVDVDGTEKSNNLKQQTSNQEIDRNPWDPEEQLKIAAILVPDKSMNNDGSPADDIQSPIIVLAVVSTMTLVGLSIGLLLVVCRRLVCMSKPRYIPLREATFGIEDARAEFPTNYLVAPPHAQHTRLLPK